MRPRFVPLTSARISAEHLCPCCAWQPRAADHELGLCRECRVCLHCERQPSASGCGLCVQCQQNEFIRVLYRRGRRFDPAWEQHLRELTRWHQQQLAHEEEQEPPAAAGA